MGLCLVQTLKQVHLVLKMERVCTAVFPVSLLGSVLAYWGSCPGWCGSDSMKIPIKTSELIVNMHDIHDFISAFSTEGSLLFARLQGGESSGSPEIVTKN